MMMTCLQKKPENRYPSFVDLSRALEIVCGELSPGKAVRKIPNLVGLKADTLNNQAVSPTGLGPAQRGQKAAGRRKLCVYRASAGSLQPPHIAVV